MFKGLLYLAILTSSIVASWVGFSVYHSYTTSTITGDTSIVTAPIDPEFDRKMIEKIKAKRKITADLKQELPGVIETQEATVSAQKTASDSGQTEL